MILTELVTVKVISTTLEHYKKLGYNDIVVGSVITIKPNELTLGSKVKVLVKCDCCGKEKIKVYKSYMISYLNGNYYACSNECSKEKRLKTNLERYGVDNVFKNEDIKDKIKNTNLERHGVEYPSQSKEIREKIVKTLNENYGVDNPMDSNEIKEKHKKTNLEKYGVDSCLKLPNNKELAKKAIFEKYGVVNIMKLEFYKNKREESYIKNFGTTHPMKNKDHLEKIKEKKFKMYYDRWLNKNENLNIIANNNNIFTCECDKKVNHTFEINSDLLRKRLKYNVTLCTICNNPRDSRTSEKENELHDFIKSIDDSVLSNYQVMMGNNKRFEIDVFSKKYNLGFEFNGLYWHSEIYKTKDYHYLKYKNSLEKGIKLFQIWEDDWIYKKDIIKSIIKIKYGIFSNKIFARKCNIKNIDNKTCSLFLDENHIQGDCPSTYRYGLYFNNELVSVMTFGYRNINSKKVFELLRYSIKKDTIILGGGDKLFKYVLNDINIDCNEIVSYCDVSLFDGGFYERIGFEYKEHTSLNYYWIVDGIRYHRFTYNKKKLIKMGYDKNLTENEIMINYIKAYKIWGTGMKKYVFNI